MAQLASTRGILIGYRRLYRYGLRAVHYSKPARFVLRDVLRRAFRTESALVYDEVKVQNTLQFFDLAAREQAMEHRILKNILHVRYWTLRNKRERKLISGNSPLESQIRLHSMDHFDSTIDMLNKSLGLCLR